jgi:hypothetical protein
MVFFSRGKHLGLGKMMRLRVVLAIIFVCFWANAANSQTGGTGGGDEVRRNSGRTSNSRNMVRNTKRYLYQLNYDVGAINNILDSKTRIAIRKVQRKLDMDVSGRVSLALEEILRKTKKSTIWGAISATTGGGYGSVWNYKSRRAAERNALANCRKRSKGTRCGQPITATRSSCIALVTYKSRGRKGYVSRTRRSLKLAMNSAMAGCKQKLRSKSACNIRTYICADGSHK